MAGLLCILNPTGCGFRAPACRRRSTKPAFTLVELLIVVALLAAVLTLSLPSLRKLSTKSELQDAARQLRVTLLQTRLAAIESGSPCYFRYQPGGTSFEAGPAPNSVARPTPEEGPLADTERNASPAGASAPDQVPVSQTLPRGVRFAEPLTDRQLATSAAGDDLPENDSRSAPLLFYPNGRTRNARIALVNEPYRIELTVRGLTGTVHISRVERLPPAEAAAPEQGPEATP